MASSESPNENEGEVAMRRKINPSYLLALGLVLVSNLYRDVEAQLVDLDLSTRVQGQAFGTPSYDYVPSVTWDGRFRVYWCAGVAGDFIRYTESISPTGPWSAPVTAIQPTNSKNDFDGQHTCDPSFLQVGGTKYLYYGGFPRSDGAQPKTTMIGVATSKDGLKWTRANAGKPIIKPHGDYRRFPNPYGAGQPSALYLDGFVYLLFYDSTGANSNPINGGGIYAIRSRDPLFQGSVEEWTRAGFKPRVNVNQLTTEAKIWDASSADWQFCDRLNGFLLFINGVPGYSHIALLDRSMAQRQLIAIPGVPWTEGPGASRTLDGHSLPHGTGSKSRVPISLFYSFGGTSPYSWDIGFTGVDLIVR
jgi:hypothetical protein